MEIGREAIDEMIAGNFGDVWKHNVLLEICPLGLMIAAVHNLSFVLKKTDSLIEVCWDG